MKIKEILKTSETKIMFMSDLHYNHSNIIWMNNRGYDSVGDMNKYIEEILEKVDENTILFDLGDLFWRTSETRMLGVLEKIKAKRLVKILGNHDKEKVYSKSYVGQKFEIIADYLDIRVEHEGVIYPVALSHYPMVSWNNKSRGAFMIHGHTHGNIDQFNQESVDLRLDIGFDGQVVKNYGSFIVPFEYIFEEMEKKAGSRKFMNYVQKTRNNL